MEKNFESVDSIIQYVDSLDDFKVLKRINPQKTKFNSNELNEPVRKAIYLDCEATGLNFDSDKPIELGMIVFTYGVNTGTIFEITNTYSGLEDPGYPLTDEIKRITGISDEDLKGQAFEDECIEKLLEDVTLIIAHNAYFDRNMLEKRLPCFKEMAWACSAKDIDWSNYEVEGIKLEYLLFKFGYFYQGHRALIDCFAGLTLLAQNISSVTEGNEIVMNLLLKKARSTSYIIKAIRAPFEKKDMLKQRGYRWHNDGNFSEKFWWTEVNEDDYKAELNFLSNEVYASDFPLNLHNIKGAILKIDAKMRYKKLI